MVLARQMLVFRDPRVIAIKRIIDDTHRLKLRLPFRHVLEP